MPAKSHGTEDTFTLQLHDTAKSLVSSKYF